MIITKLQPKFEPISIILEHQEELSMLVDGAAILKNDKDKTVAYRNFYYDIYKDLREFYDKS